MIINYLVAENFKSFKQKTLFDLEIKKREQNIILIDALNGRGKTGFLQAIHTAFFGIGKAQFDKLISYGKEDEKMVIEVEFYNTNDSKIYKVHREYSYNENKTAINSYFRLYIDEVLIEDFDEEQWKLFLQTEFPEEISKFFFFDGEKIQEIIDYKNPREIKIAIEKILGIEDIRNLRDNLMQIKSRKLRDFSYEQDNKNVKSLNLQLEDLTEKKKSLLAFISKGNEKIEEITKRLVLISRDIENLIASGLSENKLKEWEEYNEKVKDFEKEKYLLEKKLEEFLNNNLDSFLLLNNLDQLILAIETNEKPNEEVNPSVVLNFLKKLYIPNCVHCGNDFNKEGFLKVEERVAALIEEYSKQAGDYSLDIEGFKRSSSVLLSKEVPDINHILDQLEQMDIKISGIEREINAIGRMGNSKEQIENMQKLREDYESYTNEKIKLERDVDSINVDLSAVEDRISSLELELEGFVKNAETNEIEREAIDLISNILLVLDEYITILVIDKRRELTEKTEQMFKLLSNTDEYDRVEINDTYQVAVYDKGGKEQTNLSSGFKQILMTALVWGLKECSEKNLPVIIDTPIARLDPIHRTNMLKKYFPIAAPQVIILSQPSEITKEDLKNKEWTRYFRDGSYIEMDKDNILGTSVLKTIII